MRAAAALLLVLAAGLPTEAAGASISARNLAAAMQGCWSRINWPQRNPDTDPLVYTSPELCLDGGVEGSAAYINCSGTLHIECREIAAAYAFRDEKFWIDYGAETMDRQLSNCDVTLGPGQRLVLHNCQWIVPTGNSTPIADVVYEKAP